MSPPFQPKLFCDATKTKALLCHVTHTTKHRLFLSFFHSSSLMLALVKYYIILYHDYTHSHRLTVPISSPQLHIHPLLLFPSHVLLLSFPLFKGTSHFPIKLADVWFTDAMAAKELFALYFLQCIIQGSQTVRPFTGYGWQLYAIPTQ